jgi:hypothetical protein
MSASNYNAPARKKQKAATSVSAYIRATIPMITSYANVVAGKKSKSGGEEFPMLTSQTPPKDQASQESMSSLTKASQAKVSKDPIIEELSKQVSQLKATVENQALVIDSLQKMMVAFLTQAQVNQVQSSSGTISPVNLLMQDVLKQLDPTKDIQAPNVEDTHGKGSTIVDDTILEDNNLPSTTMNNQSEDIKDAYMAQPCRAKHPREEQDTPESNQDQDQPSHETPPTSSSPVEQTRASGPMDKFIKSKSPLPAPQVNVQRGGNK